MRLCNPECITIMYDTVRVSGYEFEAACAFEKINRIMGQISSNPSQGQMSRKNDKVYHRYSSPPIATRPFANEEDEVILCKGVIRDSKRVPSKSSQKGQLENSDGNNTIVSNTSASNRKVSNSSMRPVTVTEMNNLNRQLDCSANLKNKPEITETQSVIKEPKIGDTDRTKTSSSGQTKNRDVFAVEGYHKTDHCYFKRPDGGYIKLPPDSFHKMTEGCYIKRSDGTFVRIDSAATICNSQMSNKLALPNDSVVSSGNRPKSTMLRFLKRSKSHTPSTMKELQREKERNEKYQNRLAVAERNAAAQQASAGQPAQNRRVMVTMIDGGLPVLATSKADRVPKPKSHLHVKTGKGKDLRNKVNKPESN